MESIRAPGIPEGKGAAAPDIKSVLPLTSSILSQVVEDAIDHTDTKLAFDMMLVNDHLQVQDASNRLLKDEVVLLKEAVAKQTQEHSEMYQYFHLKTDKHVARIAELETLLAAAQKENERLVNSAKEALVARDCERLSDRAKAQEEVGALREELRQVHAYVAAKRELEAHTFSLETQLEAQRVAFETKIQDLERNNLVQRTRTKQELLGRMQAAKAELMSRTSDQVASVTQRTLLENEHFTKELAFQSRETEKLIERLDEAHHEVAKLRAHTKVLESNEQLMAKKNHYYQKILAKLQPSSARFTGQVQLKSPKRTNRENDSDADKAKVSLVVPPNDHLPSSVDKETKNRLEIETQLQHAVEWLRLFQRERQFILAKHDEVIQFLYRALDEAVAAQRRRSDCHLELSKQTPAQAERRETLEMCDVNTRVEDLLQLASKTTTMEAFARQVLLSRPALDELSSDDAHEVLLFLLEKLQLYQIRIASVFSEVAPTGASSPMKQMLERHLGIELPPIAPGAACRWRFPSVEPKRCLFAQAATPVNAGKVGYIESHKPKSPRVPRSPVPLSPQLLVMATNQFNFVGQTPPAKRNSLSKRQSQNSSLGTCMILSPSRKTRL